MMMMLWGCSLVVSLVQIWIFEKKEGRHRVKQTKNQLSEKVILFCLELSTLEQTLQPNSLENLTQILIFHSIKLAKE
jgi:hypothetical protein